MFLFNDLIWIKKATAKFIKRATAVIKLSEINVYNPHVYDGSKRKAIDGNAIQIPIKT